MFKSFRWQIALWFVGLSSLIYLVFSLVGGLYFYTSLTHSMDEELKVVASQIGHAIDVSGSRPTFRDWLRVVDTEPARSLMSMQLFTPSGALLEHYGPIGIPRLFVDQSEIRANGQTMRIRQSKLLHSGALVGYVQLQLPADKRDALTKQFLLTMAIMAPFVLFGFGLCSYIVSGIAAKPIEVLVTTLQQFVADAGHELNTPTSIVQARVQSLERKLAKKGIVQEDVTIIASSAERMGRIVKNLMLLAELDGRYQRSAKTIVNLKELVLSSSKEFASRFEERNISFQVKTLDEVTAMADQESIDCMLRNLLENALRYTESAGSVCLSCYIDGTDACLAVEDTGLGISEACLPFIFDRFYRVDESRSRDSGGSGLGLAIVKAITESLDGRLHVESQIGKGSRFYVFLPICKNSTAQKLHTSIQ